MTVFDLLFLASALFFLFLLGRVFFCVLRRNYQALKRTAILLGSFLAVYTLLLASTALPAARHVYHPRQPRCFDEWCVSGISARRETSPQIPNCASDAKHLVWIATVEIASTAGRISQRAPDATATLEDQHQHTYQPCAAPIAATPGEPAHTLADELAPDEHLQVHLPFLLPLGEQPKGVVIRHGFYPSVFIIGNDQSFFRANALSEVTVLSAP